MNNFGAVSYSACALAFALLAALLVAGWRGLRRGVLVIAACAATAVWAGMLAAEHLLGGVPVLGIYLAEAVRNSAWLLALVAVAGGAAPRWLAVAVRAACAILLFAAVAAPALEATGVLMINPTLLLSRAGLIAALLGLILLEQIYRNSSQHARASLKYLAIGVGALFAYDVFLYSQAELMRGLPIEVWSARGALNALAAPLIAVAARRNPEWSLDVFISRQVVFYSTTFLIVGAYLVVMALGGYYVREFGGAWGGVGQVVFFSSGVVALVSLVASTALRRRAWVFISKHFYRNKYDYRVEWLRFIGTLSSTGEEDVRRTAVRAIAQVFNSPGGVLFLHQDANDKFAPYAAWPMSLENSPGVGEISRTDDLLAFLERTRWIIDTHELRRSPDLYADLTLPAWLEGDPSLRIVSPLLQNQRLVGFIVLYDPPSPFELTYEDRDLLKTLGRHVATHLAQQEADRKLAESRQFEAYNRLTAFMMHDLKNSAAQLKLIVDNAERHKRNPEFVDDVIDTIANAAERISRLIEQLRGSAAPERIATVDLADAAREAIKRCAARRPAPTFEGSSGLYVQASRERLIAALEHLLRNAQDATPESGAVTVELTSTTEGALLTIADTGVGMDAEFVRNRLFRPFDSTKGSKGMGVGAYQAREYVLALGGKLEVLSSPGRGARFLINLPLCARPAGAVAARVG